MVSYIMYIACALSCLTQHFSLVLSQMKHDAPHAQEAALAFTEAPLLSLTLRSASAAASLAPKFPSAMSSTNSCLISSSSVFGEDGAAEFAGPGVLAAAFSFEGAAGVVPLCPPACAWPAACAGIEAGRFSFTSTARGALVTGGIRELVRELETGIWPNWPLLKEFSMP